MKEDSQHEANIHEDNSHHEDNLTADENLMRQMLGMLRRRETSHVDPDEAWALFLRDEIIPGRVRQHRFGLVHMAVAALCGAAAMLAVVFVFGLWPGKSNETDNNSGGYIALEHKVSPRHISLETDGMEETIETDVAETISFITDAVASEDVASKYRKISTPRGMGVKIILPDSSEVWLNADSYIEFPERFSKDSRKVAVSGEAFFKITPDAESPFIVKSQQLDIRVIGTEFNFNNYSSDNTQVALVSGKVEIFSPDGCELAKLMPGEAAVCDADGKIEIEDVDTYAVTQWVDGFFYFDEVPLVDVLSELGRWYNMGVVFRNKRTMDIKVHFSAMRTEPIENAIESLNRLRMAKIYVEGYDIVVD